MDSPFINTHTNTHKHRGEASELSSILEVAQDAIANFEGVAYYSGVW